ncbi:NADPH-dependent FMN reductase [Myroides odoratus]|uniref:NADPH-dependent FMN reductase n=1 Tax=Myroides odoratus TaxID=256 RepID=UPI000765FEAA|nr:NADPH-dependent FMN reductase [Myroides odoratus]
MKALIFTGALERRADSTSERLSQYLSDELTTMGIETSLFKIAESGIPLFDITSMRTPNAVELMNIQFREADIHLWLTPLYHGSMTGAMKNCFDWLEISAKSPAPYLTGKTVGLVCWADGVQAMQGINAMDAVAKALRAWPAPYSVAIQRSELYVENGSINPKYQERFRTLLQLITKKD